VKAGSTSPPSSLSALAAINTANNLLYMVLSALLAVLILSGVLSALNFRFCPGGRFRTPLHCFAGEPFSISLLTHNDKRVFPTLSLQLKTLGKPAPSVSHPSTFR